MTDEGYPELKSMTDRLCNLMGWETGTSHKFEIIRQTCGGKAAALSIEKGNQLADRLEQHDQTALDALVDAGKYETCLQAASQRLQEFMSVGEVKHIGLMEVPTAIDELIREALRWRHVRNCLARSMSPHMDGTFSWRFTPPRLRGKTIDEVIDGEIAECVMAQAAVLDEVDCPFCGTRISRDSEACCVPMIALRAMSEPIATTDSVAESCMDAVAKTPQR